MNTCYIISKFHLETLRNKALRHFTGILSEHAEAMRILSNVLKDDLVHSARELLSRIHWSFSTLFIQEVVPNSRVTIPLVPIIIWRVLKSKRYPV